MIKEIDLRAIINNNLKCESHDIKPTSLSNNETLNLKERPFEENKKWNKIEKTNYIESIFLGCALQPIIRFKNNNYTTIVDGYNRYLSIKEFVNNELTLEDKGLDQLKFLSGRKYEDLSENEKNFFNKNACIKILDYSCDTKIENKDCLTGDEELEVLKYLYTLYNTGLKLEIEEIQKAQFYDDYITKKIRAKITEDNEFLDMLESLKLYNGRRKRNKIDNILLNCRLLIASTYSNIYNFSNAYGIQDRIEENYLPNINNLNKNDIYEDFIINIKQIYNNLVNTQKWEIYSNLHSKPFIEATYWLISVIRKDKLYDPFKFDFMKYLEYFGQKEEKEKNFDIYYSHYNKNIYKKYYLVSKYFEDEYKINMSSYFEENKPKNNGVEIINSIDELYKKDFSYISEKIQISDLINQLKSSSYNLRPYYQRAEVMNSSVSSRIIESILLGIRIPYILTCDKYISGNVVTEVVDGQQRLLSILGLLEAPFMNENKELEYSNKNGYSLKNLKILTELNGCTFNKKKKNSTLPRLYANKINEGYLEIYRTKDLKDNSFNTIDHFVRLNKNASIIKENSYRMFKLTADRRIIDYTINYSSDFLGNILPQSGKDGKAYIITLRLASIIYNNFENDINLSNYTNRKVGTWLTEFNKFKEKNMYSNPEEIEKLRIKYCNSIYEVKKFYLKINKFLENVNKNIKTLCAIPKAKFMPVSYYYYLFCFLYKISEDSLMNNSFKIYDIIENFYCKIKEENLVNNDLMINLKYAVQNVLVFETNA